MFGVARANLEQVAVLAGDVMDLQDFGDPRQLDGGGHVGPVVGRTHRHERQEAPADHMRVDEGDVVANDAFGLELPKALENGGWRQSNGLRQLSLRSSGVVLKDVH